MDSLGGWALAFGLFWLVTAPVLTLLHELGHAAVALAFTRGPVDVWSGPSPARRAAFGPPPDQPTTIENSPLSLARERGRG
jgi:hypothetical protein